VPAPTSYLSADETHLEKWSVRLQKIPQPRVAVAWSGNPAHDNDRNRSLPFGSLAPFFSLSNPAAVTPSFISIQRDLRSEDAARLAAETRVTHIGGELDDFSDTAAVLALCDLVISVDTAPAHLAGALGKPFWVFVPFAPDWRWTLEGDTTPWYPTARLFRQSLPGDWDAVIARVAAALKLFGLQK
jgi:Glycosyltransferase family 9 (heptosyltransferase)